MQKFLFWQSSPQDLRQSIDLGVGLSEWFTGYWHNFAKHGDNVYRHMYENLD